MGKLTAKRVQEIIEDCLYDESEDPGLTGPPEGSILAECIIHAFGFHPERVRKHDAEIGELLAELPTGFHKDTGGGWTFLAAVFDKNKEQWGEHHDAEYLLALGLATKRVKYCLPREKWQVFPGGIPYFVVLDKPEIAAHAN